MAGAVRRPVTEDQGSPDDELGDHSRRSQEGVGVGPQQGGIGGGDHQGQPGEPTASHVRSSWWRETSRTVDIHSHAPHRNAARPWSADRSMAAHATSVRARLPGRVAGRAKGPDSGDRERRPHGGGDDAGADELPRSPIRRRRPIPSPPGRRGRWRAPYQVAARRCQPSVEPGPEGERFPLKRLLMRRQNLDQALELGGGVDEAPRRAQEPGPVPSLDRRGAGKTDA